MEPDRTDTPTVNVTATVHLVGSGVFAYEHVLAGTSEPSDGASQRQVVVPTTTLRMWRGPRIIWS